MKKLNILQTISVRWWNACAYYDVALSRGLYEINHNIIFTSDKNSPPFEKAADFKLNPISINFKNLICCLLYQN